MDLSICYQAADRLAILSHVRRGRMRLQLIHAFPFFHNDKGVRSQWRLRKTPFTSRTKAQSVTAFTIYNHMLLPTVFESLEADYWHLCNAVQVWDVSVERQISLKGDDATRLVQWMTPRDFSGIAVDRCVYLPLADENGKLLNDPVGIRLSENHWWLSISDSDVALWAKGLARGAGLDVQVKEADVWPLAVQGPLAESLMTRVFGNTVKDIRFFRYATLNHQDHPCIVSRSGSGSVCRGGHFATIRSVSLPGFSSLVSALPSSTGDGRPGGTSGEH